MTTEDTNVTLRVENLRAFYTSKRGLVRGVNDISFEILEGESVGLFGESGAGKTSVALAILGLFDGEIALEERKTSRGSQKILKINRMYNQKYLPNEVTIN